MTRADLLLQEQDGGKMYLWVASGDCDYVQLSRLDLMDHASEVKVSPEETNKKHTVNQLLFTATLFRDSSVINWFATSNFRNRAFFTHTELHYTSGS
jgi:hypothetical protein